MGHGDAIKPNRAAKPIGVVLAWLFALAPTILFVLTSLPGFGPLGSSARGFATPVIFAEVAVISIAFAERSRFRFSPVWLWLALITLLAVAFFSAAHAPNPLSAYRRNGLWILHLLFAISVCHLAHKQILSADIFMRAMQKAFIIFTSAFLIYAATRPAGFNWVSELPGFSNIRWIGYYAAAIVGVSLGGVATKDRVAIGATASALILILWTGSRGGLLVSICGTFFAMMAYRDYLTPRLWIRYSFILAVAVLSSIILDEAIPIQGVDRIVTETAGIAGGAGRIELWQATIPYILQRPWFGWGDGQTYLLGGAGLQLSHPHNIVLQIGQAWGVVGLAIILVLAAWLGRRLAAARSDAIPLVTTAAILAGFSLIDGSLYHVLPVAVFAACCGIAIGHMNSPANQSSLSTANVTALVELTSSSK